MRPRIFLGSSGQQEKLLQALTRGLQDIADVDPWTAVFNPGVSTLDRLVELTREVDFAAFVFAQDDWTTKGASPDAASGQASPRDNVVFEAGLFGGALGIRRTFMPFGSVGGAVVAVLAEAGGEMRLRDIHAEVEKRLGGSVSFFSVADFLLRRSKASKPLFGHARYGHYRLLS